MVNKEAYFQMLTTIQIKNDCETLKALASTFSQPVVALGVLPYYAIFAEEIENAIGKKGDLFKVQNKSPFSISEVRVKLKLFSDKYKKSQKQILTTDTLQDDIFKRNLRFSVTKVLNIHYNLGIFFNEDKHIIGNTQYFYFMFQDKEFNGYEYTNEEVREFGQALGTVVGSVSIGLKDFLPNIKVLFNYFIPIIKHQDFNTNRRFSLFPKSTEGKDITLRLLHVLSCINFVRYVLSKYLPCDNTYQLKVKYIAAYYAVTSIKKIINHLTNNRCIFDDEIKILFKSILEDEEKIFDSKFRSCMMHYSFINNGEYLIDAKYLNIQLPLFGLVESRFGGISYEEYNRIITCKIEYISDSLEKMLNTKWKI